VSCFSLDFVTDSSISRFNGGMSGEKELEPWDADGDDCNISLDNAVSFPSYYSLSFLIYLITWTIFFRMDGIPMKCLQRMRKSMEYNPTLSKISHSTLANLKGETHWNSSK